MTTKVKGKLKNRVLMLGTLLVNAKSFKKLVVLPIIVTSIFLFPCTLFGSVAYAQTDTTTQTFEVQLPFSGTLTQKFTSYHPAIDLAAALGTPIKPIGDGVVSEAGWSSLGYGNMVVVNHNNGYTSLYGHMGRIYVKKGQAIKKTDVLGTIGLTGNTTGPHTHLEVARSGVKINPLTILPPIGSTSTNKVATGGPSTASTQTVTELPKTGVPLLGLTLTIGAPFAWKLRKFGFSTKSLSTANSSWEIREFKRMV